MLRVTVVVIPASLVAIMTISFSPSTKATVAVNRPFEVETCCPFTVTLMTGLGELSAEPLMRTREAAVVPPILPTFNTGAAGASGVGVGVGAGVASGVGAGVASGVGAGVASGVTSGIASS